MIRRRIIIDTDPGLDDAVAILFALAASEELEILGLVAVAGNLPLGETVRNALRVCALAGRPELPVYAGCQRPLMRVPTTAAHIHTDPRLDAVLPEPMQMLQAQHGVDFLIEALRSAEPGTISLCALGPLTNIAMALVKAPEIAERIGELVVMGGAGFELGNVTPAAEFNMHADPHAAAIVVASGVPITMVPLDVTHAVLSTPPRVDALRALGNRCGAAVAELLTSFEINRRARFGTRAKALHDPSVIAYLLRPTLYDGREVNVAIETQSPLTMGMTVVDWWGVSGRTPNVRFLNTVDVQGFYELLTDKLARLP
ncbi:MAG: nucleoside hydrolase [Stellaceae bacterium]|jgi:inosine-uridine nucleoside N-ribohydrolase